MNADATLLVNSYLSWIQRTVTAEALNSTTAELTTPFLDRHNDHLQIYSEKLTSDLYLLTDDGYILAELKSSGVESRGRRREELFARLLAGHGVRLVGDELQVEASAHELGQKAHSLLQAMLGLDDMFVLAQPRSEPVFTDTVAKFLDAHDIRYTAQVKFSGRSGLDHLVDFVIPKSRSAPERVLQVVNHPRRDRVENLIFLATDTRAARGMAINYHVLLNDARQEISPDMISAFHAYDVSAEPWSRREEIAEALAA
ncbi:DUF1828 domain-containing protein [Cryptosporangium aurantiacum]|uniref:DUF1828 domain-containing protein n=1 Tax=Cryptosporangium aurantiacum TaxID=134849 RepID=A0A1M7QWC4_9ACTN|nr:DUF1828 domain-containing protein [Cryptosporangium aurantiacum]SHN35893.1 protein of unknown function DUF1829 [Cryptosporangium aurantiacum]